MILIARPLRGVAVGTNLPTDLFPARSVKTRELRSVYAVPVAVARRKKPQLLGAHAPSRPVVVGFQ